MQQPTGEKGLGGDKNSLAESKSESKSHPLEHKWVWSYKPTIVYKQQSAEDWMSDYRRLTPSPFETVEEFWSIFSHLHNFNILDYGNIYSVFRDEILPVWEHPANCNGYSIVIYVNKNNSDDMIARIYELSLLVLIGNNLPCSAIINGCTFERKAGGNKIVFWMGSTPEAADERMEQMKQILVAIGTQRKDVTFCDPSARIDWRDPKFAPFRLAVACKSHRVRVKETTLSQQPPKAQSHPQRQYPAKDSQQLAPQRRFGQPHNGGGQADRDTRHRRNV